MSARDDMRVRALASAALGCADFVDPRRIDAARAGTVNSARVTVPWARLIALLDAVETLYPGSVEAFLSSKDKQQ